VSPFTLFASHLALYSILPLAFAFLNSPLRLILLYVYVGAVLTVGGFLGSVYTIPLNDTVRLSGGTLAYGAFMMTALLMVILERDVRVLRRIVQIVIAVNVFKFLLFSVVSLSLSTSPVANPFNTSPEVFATSARFIIIGGALIIVELLTMFVILERIKARLESLTVMTVVCAALFAATLFLDGVLFPLIALPIEPALTAIAANAPSKIVMAVAYSVPVAVFLVLFRRRLADYRATPIGLRDLLFARREVLVQEIERQQGLIESTAEQRKRVEQDLKSSENRFRTLIETAPDTILGVSADGRIESASPPVEATFGYPPDELIGQSVSLLIPERFRAADGPLRTSFAASPIGIRRDGTEFPIQISMGVSTDNGDLATAIVIDVSERRRLEEELRQAQKLEAVGQLAGGIAHDFNNLLTVIAGYGAIARQEIGSGAGAAELEAVERATQRAIQLTGQLLAFSRRQVLSPTDLDLRDVATELLPLLDRLIGEDIEKVLVSDDHLPPVHADRGQIEQILMNLAVNARDAMPTGGRLTIETRAVQLDERPYVCLSVTDTGSGIDSRTMPHLFEPFFTTKGVGRGTGLGLATVHGIVTQSGGTIRVYSEPGLGATFKVHFPATVPAAPGVERVPGAAPPRLTGTETILLCEDGQAVRELINHILTRAGYTVVPTATPMEALAAMAAHQGSIDLLVSDVVMPEMAGPELAERLERLQPGLRTLFLSGYTADTLRNRGHLALGSAFLEKPFEETTLLRTVRELLDQAGRADLPLPGRSGVSRQSSQRSAT
jgi:PAS domain S-box-containing protein